MTGGWGLAFLLCGVISTAAAQSPSTTVREELCVANITVRYQDGANELLGPIMLGRGQNGGSISLRPGQFVASAEVKVCGADGSTVDEVAFRGSTSLLDWRSMSGRSSEIVIHAVDVRRYYLDGAGVGGDQPVAPLIMSISILPSTVQVEESVRIFVTAVDFNTDENPNMTLTVFDRERDAQELYSAEYIHTPCRWGCEPTTEAFWSVPVSADWFENSTWTSSAAVHELYAEVIATDPGGLQSDPARVSFSVDRAGAAVEIGALVYTAPQVDTVDPSRQQYLATHGGEGSSTAAQVRLMIKDPDLSSPPDGYVERHFVVVEALEDAVMGWSDKHVAGNQLDSPTCQRSYGQPCRFVACQCTPVVVDGVGTVCDELTVTKPDPLDPDADPGEWTFAWDPWNGTVSPAGHYGTTYCQLRLYFEDNTAALGNGAAALRTNNVTILLEASPGIHDDWDMNRPPFVLSHWAANTVLDPDENATLTVTFADTDGLGNGAPVSALFQGIVQLDGSTSYFAVESGLVATTAPSCVSDVSDGALCTTWRGVWQLTADAALFTVFPDNTGSLTSANIYVRLNDTTTGDIGFHQVTVLRRPTGRRRRVAEAERVPSASVTIRIDGFGLLTADVGDVSGGNNPATTDAPGQDAGPPNSPTDGGGGDDDGGNNNTTVLIAAGGTVVLLLGVIVGLLVQTRRGDRQGDTAEVQGTSAPTRSLSPSVESSFWPPAVARTVVNGNNV